MQELIEAVDRAYPAFAAQRSTPPASESALAFMERFARFVTAQYETGNLGELKRAFAIMEDGLESGDAATQQAIVVGFLEALQNVASHRPHGAGVFRAHLAPRSLQAWDQLNAVWEGKSTLADVVAHERGSSLETPWWQFWRRRRRRSPAELLERVENPELRAIIEGMTRDHSKPE